MKNILKVKIIKGHDTRLASFFIEVVGNAAVSAQKNDILKS
jgi:hypothetical protein